MMLRYKSHPDSTFNSSKFNTHAMSEVLTGDDSVFVRDLDVLINGEWLDLRQAFKDKKIISDNYNLYFREPIDEEERTQGYYI